MKIKSYKPMPSSLFNTLCEKGRQQLLTLDEQRALRAEGKRLRAYLRRFDLLTA